MQLQGEAGETAEYLGRGELDAAPIEDAEKVLLRLAEKITTEAKRISAADMERAREAGWTDDQIAEAVYVTAMFALFNRVADAFGLEDPNYHQKLAPKDDPGPGDGVRG